MRKLLSQVVLILLQQDPTRFDGTANTGDDLTQWQPVGDVTNLTGELEDI